MKHDELLTRLADAVIEGTLADDSLRELAAAAGTSARMLVYHFGSRDGLIREVNLEVEKRWRRLVTEGMGESGDEGCGVALARLWHSVSARRNEPLLRSLIQIQGKSVARIDGLDDGSAKALGVLREAVDSILERSGREPRERRELTTLLSFAIWAAAEYVVLTRDRVAANEGVLGLIERLGLGES